LIVLLDLQFDMERLPTWCSAFCKNSLSDVCVEDCAVSRKMTSFRFKPIEFDDIPPYPIEEFACMTKEEKAISLAIYTAKITEKIQEGENGQYSKIRQNHDYTRSRSISENVKKQSLLSSESTENPPHQASKKREGF
jgi:hypothetical protein